MLANSSIHQYVQCTATQEEDLWRSVHVHITAYARGLRGGKISFKKPQVQLCLQSIGKDCLLEIFNELLCKIISYPSSKAKLGQAGSFPFWPKGVFSG